jgi:hypothetical protein
MEIPSYAQDKLFLSSDIGRSLLSIQLNRIAYFPSLNLFYCRIPKAANTFLTYLWAKISGDYFLDPTKEHPYEEIKRKSNEAFLSLPHKDKALKKGKTLLVVRNPYIRILSCYLDKIQQTTVEKKEKNLPLFEAGRKLFTDFYKRNPDDPISFLEFLRAFKKDPALFFSNAHWAPQSSLYPSSLHWPPTFIGKVENLKKDIEEFSRIHLNKDVKEELEKKEGKENSFNSENYLKQYYKKEEISIVSQLYKEDFLLFGYSEDFSSLEIEESKLFN